MTHEELIHRIEFAADTGTVSVGTALERLGLALRVAKNYRIRLKRMHGYVISDEPIGDPSNTVRLFLVRGTDTLPSSTTALRTLWAHAMTHIISGTPVNTFAVYNGIPIEVDFENRTGNTLQRPKPAGDPNTTGSNAVSWHFSIVAIALAASFKVAGDLSIEYDLIWLPTGKNNPRSSEIMNDEEENRGSSI